MTSRSLDHKQSLFSLDIGLESINIFDQSLISDKIDHFTIACQFHSFAETELAHFDLIDQAESEAILLNQGKACLFMGTADEYWELLRSGDLKLDFRLKTNSNEILARSTLVMAPALENSGNKLSQDNGTLKLFDVNDSSHCVATMKVSYNLTMLNQRLCKNPFELDKVENRPLSSDQAVQAHVMQPQTCHFTQTHRHSVRNKDVQVPSHSQSSLSSAIVPDSSRKQPKRKKKGARSETRSSNSTSKTKKRETKKDLLAELENLLQNLTMADVSQYPTLTAIKQGVTAVVRQGKEQPIQNENKRKRAHSSTTSGHQFYWKYRSTGHNVNSQRRLIRFQNTPAPLVIRSNKASEIRQAYLKMVKHHRCQPAPYHRRTQRPGSRDEIITSALPDPSRKRDEQSQTSLRQESIAIQTDQINQSIINNLSKSDQLPQRQPSETSTSIFPKVATNPPSLQSSMDRRHSLSRALSQSLYEYEPDFDEDLEELKTDTKESSSQTTVREQELNDESGGTETRAEPEPTEVMEEVLEELISDETESVADEELLTDKTKDSNTNSAPKLTQSMTATKSKLRRQSVTFSPTTTTNILQPVPDKEQPDFDPVEEYLQKMRSERRNGWMDAVRSGVVRTESVSSYEPSDTA